MNFKTKLILSIFLSAFLCGLFAVFISSNEVLNNGEAALIAKSRAILSRLEAARTYVAEQGTLDDTISSVKKKYPQGNLTKDVKEQVLKQVPIYAAMKVGAEGAAAENYEFRVFSDAPRNKKNQATDSELEILNRFGVDTKLNEIVVKTDTQIIVYSPVRLSEKQGCLKCHGDPAQSPFGNGRDVLGVEMENWKDGKLHGGFAIISELEPVRAAAQKSIFKIIIWSLIAAAIGLATGFFMLRKSLTKLLQVAKNLVRSGESLAHASLDVNHVSQELSSATTESAASLAETSASAEEISSIIKLNSANTDKAKKISLDSEALAQSGKSEVDGLMDSMDQIANSSKKIEEIISVIEDISFQTNLLALNASVEAARAGEHGKGFSVVADAVRALAQKSSESSKQISDLINESATQIVNGKNIADRSKKALDEIVKSVSDVSRINADISSASHEQSLGVQSIAIAINELDKATQMNASVAEKTSRSATALKTQSDELYNLVGELNSVISGKED